MLTMRCRCFVVCMVHDGVGGAVSRCFCGARGADRALVVIRIARGLYGAGSVLNVCTLLFMCAVECSCRRHDAGRRVCRAESGGGASGSFGQRINTTRLSRAKYGRRVAWSVWLVLLGVSLLLACVFVCVVCFSCFDGYCCYCCYCIWCLWCGYASVHEGTPVRAASAVAEAAVAFAVGLATCAVASCSARACVVRVCGLASR